MRVRIKKDPFTAGAWRVQSKHWWWFKWLDRACAVGDDARERALKSANELMHPTIIEVEK